jgi:uncharacterized membrane protein YphA (DoxX/SURF4 family)
VLNLVPRHQAIVAQIVSEAHSPLLTKVIGVAEIGMAIWIMVGFKSRLNAAVQIVLILTMNIIEFIVVPDLLLFGKYNLLLALLFAGLIYYNEFVVNKNK